jgi:subtilisin family serine protease
MRRVLPALFVVALVAAAPAAAFAPGDQLAAKQWYLSEDHAFDAWPTPPTTLSPVRVAIVDSGVDGSLPDFADRIVDSKSFVGGNPLIDTEGHGTFVAGEIAANLDTQGIVGIAYTSQLLVAKVVKPDGTIPLLAEAAAIRWAADQGARVINLSLGGVRDPLHAARDTYSGVEAAAIAYANAKGALLVAAVGNGDEAFSQPWPYASYPAALPHVLGVSALTRSGNVPEFSNRDAIYNDLSAPGQGIFSTFPMAMTALRPACLLQGYSDCGPNEYADPEGTSFAAPQVSAAAAVLFALDPQLTNDQVASLLEHTADDANATNGCNRCAPGRDPLSGWGRVDLARAIAALDLPLPKADRYETNDDAGTQARTLWGKQVKVTATVDYYDDQIDVYRVALSGGEKVAAKLTGGWSGANIDLVLWRPGTNRVDDLRMQNMRAAQSIVPGGMQRVTFKAPGRGWYYVEVKVTSPGYGPYTLTLSKTTP